MPNKNPVLEDIRDTGFAIRDWLGPYYTLGGAVAFCIALFTLLDPSGQLVRLVAAGLFVLTVLAWVVFLSRRTIKRSASAEMPKTNPSRFHTILLAITLFFLAGMFLSEVLMRGKLGGGTTSTSVSAPAAVEQGSDANPGAVSDRPARSLRPEDSTQKPLVAVPADSASVKQVDPGNSQAPAVSAALPAAEPAWKFASPAPAVVAMPVVKGAVAKVQKPRSPAPSPRRESSATNKEPVAVVAPEISRALHQRCSSLLGKFSLGEELRSEDKRFLETSCH